MLSVAARRLLGLAALIAAGGRESESGRPSVRPPAVPPVRVPTTVPPAAVSAGRAEKKAKEVAPRPIPGFRRPFDAPLRAPAVATGDLEFDPLVSYLKASFAVPPAVSRKNRGPGYPSRTARK